jgi:hypothetical protein
LINATFFLSICRSFPDEAVRSIIIIILDNEIHLLEEAQQMILQLTDLVLTGTNVQHNNSSSSSSIKISD